MTGQPPPEFDAAYKQAHRWPAFSNGYEGQRWTAGWCGTCVFGNDGDGCALVDVALVGRAPAQWKLRNSSGLISRYDCAVYQPERADRDVREYLATEPGGTA